MSQVRRPPVRAACLMVGSRRDGITCIPLWPPGTLALRTPQGLSPAATVAVGKGTLLVPAAYGQSPITGPTLKGSHRSAPPVAERLLKARGTVGSTTGYSCCSPPGSTERSNFATPLSGSRGSPADSAKVQRVYVFNGSSRFVERGRNRTFNLLIKSRLELGTRFQTNSL